jgi:O-succinylbenzoic acid--CoA ligase
MARRLLAFEIPGGAPFVEALRRAWDDGDAVFPIDPRLPRPAVETLFAAIRPTHVVSVDRVTTALPGGVPIERGDALVVATSGTTGDPKGAVLTHEAVRASALATSERLRVDPASDHWLACLPLAHIGGLSVVTRALVTNTPLTVLPGFDAPAVDQSKATLVSLVPAALARVDASRWRIVLLGGSAMPASLPANIVRTYGMTETGSGIVYDGAPLRGVEVRVEVGEIFVRANMLLRAYRSDDPTGRDPKTTDGWFATGDGGTFTDGVLHVDGRIGDVIVTGGEKVWPDAVERILRPVRGVADIAVVGRPDNDWGSRVVAYVVPVEAGQPPTLDQLRAAVKGQLGAWAAPRELVVLRELPRTALGKVLRHELGSVTR